jgi:hypothetical protein
MGIQMSAAPSTQTQGVDALQSNRLVWVMRMGLWAVAGVIVLAALALGSTAAMLPTCGSCHMTNEFKRNTLAQAHAKIDCARCHVKNDAGSRLAYTTHEIFGMVLHVVPEAGRATAQVDDATCLSCHESGIRGVIAAKGLRVRHASCAGDSRCTDCHSATAHGASVRWRRSASMDMCLDCHVPKKVRASCDTCHTAERSAERLASGSWQVTHGPQWKSTHGMGDWNTCGGCHASDYCARCHHISLPHDSDFKRTHGATASRQLADCRVCHRDSFCSDCHVVQMPHPASFTPVHPAIVKSKGQATCLKCHDQLDCETCHVKHEHPGGVMVRPKAPQ